MATNGSILENTAAGIPPSAHSTLASCGGHLIVFRARFQFTKSARSFVLPHGMSEPSTRGANALDKVASPARLKIAVAIFRLTPRGGLEDNCIRIATELERRGHSVTFFVAGEVPELPTPVVRLTSAASRRTNHGRITAFAHDVLIATMGKFDRTVAFQTIPGTDVVFLADRIRNPTGTPFWKRMTPRFRAFAKLEAECFRPGSPTKIIGLAPQQMEAFAQRYGTEPSRIRIAPATLSRAKCKPDSRNPTNRTALRSKLAMDSQSKVWLWLGLAPKTKGLDRVIEAISIVPDTHVLVGGLSLTDRNMLPMLRLAKRYGVEDRVHCLGYLSGESLFQAMAASDALAHPARADVTGGVILEAIINGLPVVATDVCGFAHHILKSRAGGVLENPFEVRTFARLLEDACGERNHAYSSNGIEYGNRTDLFSGIEHVSDLIEAETWPAHQT